MIANPNRLMKGVPPGTIQAYKLGLINHFVLLPLGGVFDFAITSAYRNLDAQANLKDSAGKPIPKAKKAKGISQHCLGEAVDIDGRHNKRMYLWILDNLRPWQTILYFEQGRTTGVHVSIPSENEIIVSKSLLNVDGGWSWYRGEFPAEA